MKINFWHPNSMGIEKLRDLDVMPVFFALKIVFHENESLLRRALDSIKFPVRSTLIDRRDLYLIDVQTREMHARLAKKKIIGSHD